MLGRWFPKIKVRCRSVVDSTMEPKAHREYGKKPIQSERASERCTNKVQRTLPGAQCLWTARMSMLMMIVSVLTGALTSAQIYEAKLPKQNMCSTAIAAENAVDRDGRGATFC